MDSKILTEALRSLLLAVRQDIKPDLSSAQAQSRADMIDMVLARLATEVDVAADAGTPAASPLSRDELDALHKAVAPDINKEAELHGKIAAFADAEQARRSTIESRLAELSKVAAVAEQSGDNKPLPKEFFSEYLRGKFPDRPAAEVTKVTVIPGGRSKGTILLDLEGPDGPDAIVIRRDFAVNTTGVSVTYEYPIIEALFKAGVAVPEPRWLEEDTSVIGGAFIGFSKISGKAMGTLFQSDAPPGFIKNFAATLARMHALDIDKAGIGDKLQWGDAAHPVKAMLDDYYRDYINDVPPTAIMDAAFAWLYLQLDKIGNQRTLVHGDAGLHNTMGEGDTFTGMLDWEFCHAGDPAEDLTYHKHLIEKLLPWDEFMAAYKANGGQDVSEIRLQFFTIWRSVLLGVMMGRATNMFYKGINHDLRIATIGLNSFPRIMNDLARDLAKFTKA